MAINVNLLWTSIQNLGNVWRTGFLSPSKFNDYVQQVSIELFNEKYLAAKQNNKIDDDLAPFLKSENLPVSAPEGANWGLVTRPVSEYNYFWSMRAFFTGASDGSITSCGCPTSDNKACDARQNLTQPVVSTDQIPIVKEVPVDLVSDTVWSSVLRHRKKFPTLDRPYATQYSGGFKIAPRNLSIVTLDNYRLPKPAVFGYTLLPSGYFQYNQGTSTDLEWPEQVFDEFVDRVLKLFSVQVLNAGKFQMADNLKNTRV